jgi:hypothetical protein
VIVVDESGRMVASNFSVPTEQVAQVVEQLTRKHSGAALRVMVDGHDVTDAATRTPSTARTGTGPASELAAPVPTTSSEGERATAELAHYMLWESFKRACQTQSYMLDKMTGCAVEMNRRFVEELETMRGNYTKALERLDGIEFEKRMVEHEAASRRLTAHHLRLAEEDHRAAERRRDDERSVLEQIARGVMRVVDVIGSDSINGSGNGSGKN